MTFLYEKEWTDRVLQLISRKSLVLFRKWRKKNCLLFQYKNWGQALGLKQGNKVLFHTMYYFKINSVATECYSDQSITRFNKQLEKIMKKEVAKDY